MSHRPALRSLVAALLVAGAAAGCAQPGTQAPKPEAARLSHATGDISLACGYAEELTAYGGAGRSGLGAEEATAATGAHLLAEVFSRGPSWVYQGESVAGVVSDSISLLGECGLRRARRTLQTATAR